MLGWAAGIVGAVLATVLGHYLTACVFEANAQKRARARTRYAVVFHSAWTTTLMLVGLLVSIALLLIVVGVAEPHLRATGASPIISIPLAVGLGMFVFLGGIYLSFLLALQFSKPDEDN